MRGRLKKFQQMDHFNRLTLDVPGNINKPFNRGEKMPPRFTLKGISIAVRVLSHEIRDFTQRKTGKDIGTLCKTARPEIFEKLENIAKQGLPAKSISDKLTRLCNTSSSQTLNSLSMSLKSFVRTCPDELVIFDDVMVAAVCNSIAISPSRGGSDFSSYCSGPTRNARDCLERMSNSWIQRTSDGKLFQQFGEISGGNLSLAKSLSLSLDSGLDILGGLGQNEWQPFMSKDKWSVERKYITSKGFFVYKIQGIFDDITAYDFYKTQVDIDYRLSWDHYALKLQVLETETTDTSEVIHWITKCPYPMKNREYIFERKFWVLPEENSIVVMSRSTGHASIPENTDLVRVKNYGSQMVIKPVTDIDEDGVEFTLIYYDDPQTCLPAYCLDMITKTGIADQMTKMHTAAARLKEEQIE